VRLTAGTIARVIADAEPGEHFIEHAVADLDAAELRERTRGFPQLDRDDLRGPPRLPGRVCRPERIARCGRQGLLPCGRDERLLAALLVGDARDGQDAAPQLVEP